MRFIAEHPNIYPYFFNNKDLSEAKDEEERVQILSTADMIVSFIDLIAVQLQDLPREHRPNWEKFMTDQYHSSPVLRSIFIRTSGWYSSSVLNLVTASEKQIEARSREL